MIIDHIFMLGDYLDVVLIFINKDIEVLQMWYWLVHLDLD